MENPFKEGDRVVILRKGIETEAVVRTTWQHEVQVRVQDGELLWRTVKTILRSLPPLPAEESPSPATAASLPQETTTAERADSREEEREAVDAGDTNQQPEEEENQEPLVVIELPSARSSRRDRQKRSGSRRKK